LNEYDAAKVVPLRCEYELQGEREIQDEESPYSNWAEHFERASTIWHNECQLNHPDLPREKETYSLGGPSSSSKKRRISYDEV